MPVPAIVSETTFALAEERLQANKKHAPRRTIAPSILQGIVSCSKCGYALYRTSTHSSARKIYYYVAWDRIATGISVDRFVTIIRSAKTCLIRSCGTRL